MDKKASGFTLIELLIVVVLIGVLAAIAIPAYQDYAKRARRADAKSSILEVQLAQEKWRANNPQYTTDMTDLGYSGAANQTSRDGYYTIDLPTAASSATYTVTATIKAGTAQVGDDCGTFTFTYNQGAESYTAGGDDAECWNK